MPAVCRRCPVPCRFPVRLPCAPPFCPRGQVGSYYRGVATTITDALNEHCNHYSLTYDDLYPYIIAATVTVGSRIGGPMPRNKQVNQSKTPLYEEVAGQVTRLIEEGTFCVGAKLPS